MEKVNQILELKLHLDCQIFLKSCVTLSPSQISKDCYLYGSMVWKTASSYKECLTAWGLGSWRKGSASGDPADSLANVLPLKSFNSKTVSENSLLGQSFAASSLGLRSALLLILQVKICIATNIYLCLWLLFLWFIGKIKLVQPSKGLCGLKYLLSKDLKYKSFQLLCRYFVVKELTSCIVCFAWYPIPLGICASLVLTIYMPLHEFPVETKITLSIVTVIISPMYFFHGHVTVYETQTVPSFN